MNKRVLVVDDDAALLGTVHELLAARDVEHVAVSSHDDFLTALATLDPTHVVLDPAVPGLDGIEIIQHLATRHSGAALIITSNLEARLLDAVKRAAAGKGLRVISVTSKPVTPETLAALLESTKDVSRAAPTLLPEAKPVMETTLRAGIEQKRFHFVYQPKISCSTGRLAGFEALARWYADDGVLQPLEFIPAAERLGLMRSITQQLLGEGLRWMASNHRDSDIVLCTNLSNSTLSDAEFPEFLALLCKAFDISPTRIVLELTETATMRDPTAALEMVTRLRLKGFHAAIDDVGTGYSSLSQLVRLPFSELKVDKTFVRRLSVSSECRTIVEAFIQLGHRLGLIVIAEGVEDEETMKYLASKDCDFAQGYYIARPMTAENAASWHHADGA